MFKLVGFQLAGWLGGCERFSFSSMSIFGIVWLFSLLGLLGVTTFSDVLSMVLYLLFSGSVDLSVLSVYENGFGSVLCVWEKGLA